MPPYVVRRGRANGYDVASEEEHPPTAPGPLRVVNEEELKKINDAIAEYYRLDSKSYLQRSREG